MSKNEPRPLTPKETEVLRLMAAGLTNEQVAEQLSFGIDAAKIHAKHIYQKLDASNRAHAVSIGFTSGLLDEDDIRSLAEELREAGIEDVVEPVAAEKSDSDEADDGTPLSPEFSNGR